MLSTVQTKRGKKNQPIQLQVIIIPSSWVGKQSAGWMRVTTGVGILNQMYRRLRAEGGTVHIWRLSAEAVLFYLPYICQIYHGQAFRVNIFAYFYQNFKGKRYFWV